MSLNHPHPTAGTRTKIAIGVAATLLAGLAMALVVVLESPGAPPPLGQAVRAGEQGTERRSAPANRSQPGRPRRGPTGDPELARGRDNAPPQESTTTTPSPDEAGGSTTRASTPTTPASGPGAQPSPGAQPVPSPGVEDAGDEDDEEASELGVEEDNDSDADDDEAAEGESGEGESGD